KIKILKSFAFRHILHLFHMCAFYMIIRNNLSITELYVNYPDYYFKYYLRVAEKQITSCTHGTGMCGALRLLFKENKWF
ncbi:MAG: hypothetical protein L6420_11900, partial [Elusimicrobia bacterium]|nr:hypothetical protein [Elusimicrobiota bacterium]